MGSEVGNADGLVGIAVGSQLGWLLGCPEGCDEGEVGDAEGRQVGI